MSVSYYVSVSLLLLLKFLSPILYSIVLSFSIHYLSSEKTFTSPPIQKHPMNEHKFSATPESNNINIEGLKVVLV